MLFPYLLGIAVGYGATIEAINELEDAKNREYRMWYYKDEPIPPGKLLKVFVGSIMMGVSFHYEFSAHVAMICMLCITSLSWLVSWKRFTAYKKIGSLIASTVTLLGMVVFAYRIWNQFPI